jgi:hypothetical protein
MGGKSKAVALWSKLPLCDPSQNGLFFECPHLQRDTDVLPPKPYTFPDWSTISMSPSICTEPLFLTVILVFDISIFKFKKLN